MNNNPFANYTLSIANSYEDVQQGIRKAQKPVKRRIYQNLNALLKESFFLGASRFGNNFIC